LPFALAACSHVVPPATPSGVREGDRTPTLPAGLGAARTAYMNAWSNPDHAALAAFFTEDARVVFADETLEGRARIHDEWLAEDAGRVSDLVMVPERVDPRDGEVTEGGTVTLRFRGDGGTVRAERGTYEHVWVRQPDGAWKLRSVRMNTHPAPPQ
jgi:ketosteroid isomerase-like protein